MKPHAVLLVAICIRGRLHNCVCNILNTFPYPYLKTEN